MIIIIINLFKIINIEKKKKKKKKKMNQNIELQDMSKEKKEEEKQLMEEDEKHLNQLLEDINYIDLTLNVPSSSTTTLAVNSSPFSVQHYDLDEESMRK